MIDNIITNTLLPDLARQIPQQVHGQFGVQISRVRLQGWPIRLCNQLTEACRTTYVPDKELRFETKGRLTVNWQLWRDPALGLTE